MVAELTALRDQIDEVDKALLSLLAKRLELVAEVGEVKSQYGLPIYVPEREAAMLASRREEAAALGVPPDLIEDVLRRVMRESYSSENDKGFKTLHPNLRPVVIVGGGLAGTEAALELAMQGKQVTLVEMGIDVARDANSIHKPALMMELKDHAEQVTILCRTTCTGIHDHGIVCRDADGKELTLDADTVILAAGMAPLRAEALALEPVSSEFRMVGDCKRPRQILEAVREGYDAAMEV